MARRFCIQRLLLLALLSQFQEGRFRKVLEHTHHKLQLAFIVSFQEPDEAFLHLLVEGTVGLIQFLTQRGGAEQDLLFIIGQRLSDDQFLGWQRELVRRKWTFKRKGKLLNFD